MLGEIGDLEEGDDRGWDGWMTLLTWWTWVWVNSGSWWWTGRPGVLRFMRLQRVGHDWATELNWTEALHRIRCLVDTSSAGICVPKVQRCLFHSSVNGQEHLVRCFPWVSLFQKHQRKTNYKWQRLKSGWRSDKISLQCNWQGNFLISMG